jgi:hypothetical protein
MGMGMISADKVIETTKRSSTESKMDVIEKALADFQAKNNRLPCPATMPVTMGTGDYGVEKQFPAGDPVCPNHFGAVPVKTLGLPDEYLLDGWGRVFRYVANTQAFDSFSSTPVSIEGINNAVVDASGGRRSAMVAYILISHGTNGYGAYLPDGTQLSTTGASVDELQNFNEPYVQKDVMEGGAAFDDVVRFKERWQMTSGTSLYSGPQFVRATSTSGNFIIAGYKFGLSSWVGTNNVWGSSLPGVPAGLAIAGATIKSINFTPNNMHLFVYASSSPYCFMVRRLGSQFANVPGTVVPSCPTYNSGNAVAMSNNGYLAISNTADSTVRLWRQSGDGFVYLGGDLSPGLTVSEMSFSNNADMLLLRGAAGSSIKVYRRNANGLGFTLAPVQPVMGGASPYLAAISPNGRHIAVVDSGSPATLYLWRINQDNSFTSLTSKTTAANFYRFDRIAFSPDSKYIAIGSITGAGNTSPVIYKIDAGDVFTGVNITATTGSVPVLPLFAMDANGNFFMQNGNSTTEYAFGMRTAATNFGFLRNTAGGAAQAVAFAR